MVQTIKKVIPRPVRAKISRHYPGVIRSLKTVVERSCQFFPDTIKGIGNEFFHYFLELGRLKPNENVLEVGYGIGRMSVPLMGYLKDGGRYEGFDIVSHGIRWCKRRITRRAPHFHFLLADIYNHGFNPAGKYKAKNYRFPYKDQSFDFVFLTSVFTHMLPWDMEHYLFEIHRVLKTGGRSFITYFLLNEESLEFINSGLSSIDFRHEIGGSASYPGYRIKDPEVPEAAVAYPEKYIKELHGVSNMEIFQPIRYGSWCGRKEFLSYQDIVMARKLGV